MISTVADFLEEFKSYALSKIEAEDSDIKHRPTIGNIYEGLTSELLNRAIFENLDFQLVQHAVTCNSRSVAPESFRDALRLKPFYDKGHL